MLCRLIILAWVLFALNVQANEDRYVDLGRLSDLEWEQLIQSAADRTYPGQKISVISSAFLGLPYQENSLIGSPTRSEVMVMNLTGVDCFTFLDYVEAMRRSTHFQETFSHLKQVRYKNGEVEYLQRRHFFSDWIDQNSPRVKDVTTDLAPSKVRAVSKQLNRKTDGSLWLPGLPVTSRTIVYLPVENIDQRVISALQTGDYLGIYSDRPGLDVSHTGIFIRIGSETFFRHASSQTELNSVVDSDLMTYLENKSGIIVYRPR